MAGWMINCKEYASLLSQSLDQSMTFWEKLSIRMHQIVCPPCKQIKLQFDAMRKACRFTPEGMEPKDAEGNRLSDEVCAKMKTILRNTVNEKDL